MTVRELRRELKKLDQNMIVTGIDFLTETYQPINKLQPMLVHKHLLVHRWWYNPTYKLFKKLSIQRWLDRFLIWARIRTWKMSERKLLILEP